VPRNRFAAGSTARAPRRVGMAPAWLLAGLFTALLAAAPGHAQTAQVGIENPDVSTPVTMFFHLDAMQHFPINTQPPDDRYARADDLGLIAFTTTCVPDPTGQFGIVSQSFHTLYGFSTPGYVEYSFSEQGGPRVHPERGIARDVGLDAAAGATLHWYLQTKVLGDNRVTPAAVENTPVVVPQVTVRATIRSGDDVSVGAEAYNAGSLIAAGTSAPMNVYPDSSNPHYIMMEDGTNLYEFVVPLDVGAATITQDEAFNVRVDLAIAVPGCDTDPDQSLMTSNLQTHTSPEYRPRLDWSITNPVAIEYIHPQFVGDALVIHTAFSSPWGNYDVDESLGGVTVRIQGPSLAPSLVRTALLQRHHEHGHHFEPVDVTYSWPYRLDNAANGDYTLEIIARNDQHTAEAVGRAAFEIGRNIGVDSDGNEVRSAVRDEAEDSPLAFAPFVGALFVCAAYRLAGRRQ
jgi:hypothetical protein